jgi:hypothetical protein
VSGNREIDQYDLQGQLTEGSFYDAEGKRIDGKGNTYAILRMEYAAQGQQVTTRYFGTDEKPVIAKDGCATLREDRNAEGQALRDACFDANGRPMASMATYGAAVVTLAYDAGGLPTEIEGFDPAGNPIEIIYGYARFKVTEDGAGNVAQKDYFDRNGVLILRWTPAKSCGLSQPGTSNPTADCMISDASRAFLRSGQQKSVWVVSGIYDSSTAIKIQLHLGDILLENDGITSMNELREHFKSGPDHPRTLIILRNGKQLNFEIPKGPLGVTIGVATSGE